MKILVIGGTGTIGSAVVENLKADHEVIPVGSSSGDLRVDLEDTDSITRLFERVGRVGAVISCAGRAAFGSLQELSRDDFNLGLDSKLMGQVNLLLLGNGSVDDGGSFTLTSGILAREPVPGGSAISLVNAGLEGFVRSAALELPRGIRANAVSPPWVSETLEAMGRDASNGLPADRVARAYRSSVEGTASGEVIDARDFA